MDILIKGTPLEKSLANEYISKITLRMNSGVSYPGTASNSSHAAPAKSYNAGSAPAADVPLGIKQVDSYDTRNAEERKELINKKIKSKIGAMRRAVLLKLSKSSAVKIYMEKNIPKAGMRK